MDNFLNFQGREQTVNPLILTLMVILVLVSGQYDQAQLKLRQQVY